MIVIKQLKNYFLFMSVYNIGIVAYRGYENVKIMNRGIEESHDLHFIVMEITFYVEKSILSISYF